MACPQPIKFDTRLTPSGLWLFDEADPLAVVPDEVGNVGNLTLVGANALRCTSSEFHDFNGVMKPLNCYWTAPAIALVQTAGAFTFTCIVECAAQVTGASALYGLGMVADPGTVNANNWSMLMGSGEEWLKYRGAATQFPTTTVAITKSYMRAGVLCHCVISRSGSGGTVTTSVNKVAYTSGAVAVPVVNGNTHLRVGYAADAANGAANIHNAPVIFYCAAYYNRALSQAERDAEYDYTLGAVFPRVVVP